MKGLVRGWVRDQVRCWVRGALKTKTKPNKEIINFRNKEGWVKYRDQTDKAADSIIAIAQDDINEVREAIRKEWKELGMDNTKCVEDQNMPFGSGTRMGPRTR